MGVFHVFKIVQMVPNRTKCLILTLSAPTKQNGQTNCLGMFDHFVSLVLKGLNNKLSSSVFFVGELGKDYSKFHCSIEI